MSHPRQPTADIFLKDVANHKMKVLLDQGVYRHLSFRQPNNSWCMWFDLVTWKGNLLIRGDMGTWVFNRVDDMFTFFRSRDAELRINASYWAEKIQNGANGGRESAKEFDEDTFAESLHHQLSHCGFNPDQLKEVTEALEEEVLSHDNQHELMSAAFNFKHEFTCGGEPDSFSFDPSDMPDGTDYSYHFIWCLYAIVWGIQQWDAAQVKPEAA